MQKLISMLGLARRAGRLIIGHDAVVAAVRTGRVRLVLLSADASPRHRQELEAIGYRGVIAQSALTMDDFAQGLGKRSCIFALEDESFSGAIQNMI